MGICLLLKTITQSSDDLLKATELRNKQKNQNGLLLLFFPLPQNIRRTPFRFGLHCISISEKERSTSQTGCLSTCFHTHPRGSSESRFLHNIGNQICNKQKRMREKKKEAGRERGKEGQREEGRGSHGKSALQRRF